MNIRRAVVQMAVARQATLVVTAANMVVLSRLLTPADFGLYMTMAAILALVEVLTDFGISSRLVRLSDLPRRELGTALGLALLLAGAGAALFAAAAACLPGSLLPAEGRLMLVLFALALPPSALIAVCEAVLQRDLRFQLISTLSVARVVLASGVTIGLAWVGWGAASLAAGLLAERVAAAAALLIARRGEWSVRPRLAGWPRFVAFGRSFVGMNAMLKAGDIAVVFLLNQLLGLAALGHFNRAKRITGLLDQTVLGGIAPVVLPALSRSIDAGISAARVYLIKVEHLAGLCWPAFAFIALMADQLVAVLLGAQWHEAVPAVRFLALAGAVLPISKMSMKVFIAFDAAPDYMRIQAIHQVCRILLVAAGACLSLEAACLGAAMSSFVKAGMVSRDLKLRIGYSSRALAEVALRAGTVTAFALAGPLALRLGWSHLPDLPMLVLSGLLATLGWVLGAAVARHLLLYEILRALGADVLATRVARPAAL